MTLACIHSRDWPCPPMETYLRASQLCSFQYNMTFLQIFDVVLPKLYFKSWFLRRLSIARIDNFANFPHIPSFLSVSQKRHIRERQIEWPLKVKETDQILWVCTLQKALAICVRSILPSQILSFLPIMKCWTGWGRKVFCTCVDSHQACLLLILWGCYRFLVFG
jgi:hypothetical protein